MFGYRPFSNDSGCVILGCLINEVKGNDLIVVCRGMKKTRNPSPQYVTIHVHDRGLQASLVKSEHVVHIVGIPVEWPLLQHYMVP